MANIKQNIESKHTEAAWLGVMIYNKKANLVMDELLIYLKVHVKVKNKRNEEYTASIEKFI